MGGVTGQALGMAVGAAVGTAFGQPLVGAQVGAAGAGYLGSKSASDTQYGLDQKVIELNQEQARFKASEQSALHARNFRKALASQVAIAGMRGGSGSVVASMGLDSFKNFLEDQKAIEMGVTLAETQGAISGAEAEARRAVREQTAATRAISQSTSGFNFNLLQERKS